METMKLTTWFLVEAEVAQEMASAGVPVRACSREDVEKLAQGSPWDCVLVMGARDSSLREWCRKMVL